MPVVHGEVAAALAQRRPVVALETAVLTHGLPRSPAASGEPLNLDTARRVERAVREAGGVPATIALVDGAAHVGLTDAQLESLAARGTAAKASLSNLASLLATGAAAGTTVAATLALARLVVPPLRVFATGGLGGVHTGWTRRPDVSADLLQLACSPVCVVCSGPKSLLDVPATLEALEALGVPVVGYGTDRLPRFLSTCGPQRLEQTVDSPREAARLCRAHWDDLERGSAVVLAVPTPAEHALGIEELETAIAGGEAAAEQRGVQGPARTPFVLAETARLTDGRALVANVALLEANARVAAAVAEQLMNG